MDTYTKQHDYGYLHLDQTCRQAWEHAPLLPEPSHQLSALYCGCWGLELKSSGLVAWNILTNPDKVFCECAQIQV